MLTARSACIGGADEWAGAIEEALRRGGFQIETVDDVGDLDLAVFLDRSRDRVGDVASSADRWLDDAVDAMSEAFAFARATVPRLIHRSGALVVVTTLVGDLGVPGRSLDAAVAAGITGLARCVVHEAPAISAVRIATWTPAPAIPLMAADVAWRTAERQRVANTPTDIADVLAWVAMNEAARPPGSVVTLTTAPVV